MVEQDVCDEQVSHRSADMAENSPIPPTAAPDIHAGPALASADTEFLGSQTLPRFLLVLPSIPVLVQELNTT